MPLRPPLIVLVTILALGAGCATTSEPGAAGAQGGGKPAVAKAEKRAADLEQARLQLEIARLAAAADANAAEQAVAEAGRKVEEATLAAQRFQEFERPTELAQARLRVDRAEHSVLQDEQELQQMEEMYAAEVNLDATGERTRDMVLERHRKSLEFSRRQLELAREQAADAEERELPRKQRELEWKLRTAQTDLRKAEEKLAKGQLEGRLALLKAQARIRELERGEADDKKTAKGDGQ